MPNLALLSQAPAMVATANDENTWDASQRDSIKGRVRGLFSTHEKVQSAAIDKVPVDGPLRSTEANDL